MYFCTSSSKSSVDDDFYHQSSLTPTSLFHACNILAQTLVCPLTISARLVWKKMKYQYMTVTPFYPPLVPNPPFSPKVIYDGFHSSTHLHLHIINRQRFYFFSLLAQAAFSLSTMRDLFKMVVIVVCFQGGESKWLRSRLGECGLEAGTVVRVGMRSF